MDPNKIHLILADFLTTTEFNAVAFAAKHGLTLFQLVEWFQSEAIQNALRAIEDMTHARSRAVALRAAPTALEVVARISQTPLADDDPPARVESVRRAAAQILRSASSPARPSKHADPAATRSPHSERHQALAELAGETDTDDPAANTIESGERPFSTDHAGPYTRAKSTLISASDAA